MANTFIVSDESVNSYGYIVLTDGINIEPFEHNPVMFYMHEREKGIVGRWENIRKEGKQLLADAVFDDTTQLGKQVQKQVENGFLRCASIGIDNVIKQSSSSGEMITSCDLKEISIVDMPANKNAVKLYHKSGKCVYRLCDLDDADPQELRTQILILLGLENNTTDAEILDVLRSFLKSPDNVDNEIDKAVLSGYIDDAQRGNFRAMALANRSAFLSFVETMRKEQLPTIDRMITEAAGNGKLLFNERSIYENIGNQLGINVLKGLLSTLKNAVKPTDLLYKSGNRGEWTLSDYRKFAPSELRDNPALYARLAQKEGNILEESRPLEWYRRNDPEYLLKHPEVYNHLINNEEY